MYMETEIWKDIPWYEWLYRVSNLWNVFSVKNAILLNTYKVIKYKKNTSYYKVWLYNKWKCKIFFVHRLVAISFIPNPMCKPQVNHIDWNTFNNKISNLEWVTWEENIYHAQNVIHIWNCSTLIKVYLHWCLIWEYSSISKCAKDLWLDSSYIGGQLNKWKKPYYSRWLTFKKG